MQRVKSEEKKEKYQVRDIVELRGKFSELKLWELNERGCGELIFASWTFLRGKGNVFTWATVKWVWTGHKAHM